MRRISLPFLAWLIFGLSLSPLNAREQSASLDKNPLFSPDGTQIAFLSNRDQMQSYHPQLYELYLTDKNGNGIRKLPVPPNNFHIVDCFCWSPKGDWIAYAASQITAQERSISSNGVFIVRPDGTNLRILVDKQFVQELHWAPDGRNLVYVSNSAIYIANSDTKYKLEDGCRPIWSPDSGHIAFFEPPKPRIGGPDFYVINLSDKKTTEYTLENIYGSTEHSPAPGVRIRLPKQGSIRLIEPANVYWSQDGSLIYAESGSGSIVARKANGQGYWQHVMDCPTDNHCGLQSALSPNGKEIVFILNDNIWKVNATPGPPVRAGTGTPKTRSLRQLTNGKSVRESSPSWSPDGKQIVFVRDGEIWVMNSDGSQQTQLTRSKTHY